jgi:hypothetical protein
LGYAERRRRAFWWQLWTLPWWQRLFRACSLWAVRKGFRGQFWAWLKGVRPAVPEDAETRLWRAAAGRIRDRAHLEELLLAVKDERQRALIRKKVKPMIGKG